MIKKKAEVVHEAIVDKLLIFHLENYTDKLETEIANIFDFSVENQSFASCFRTFERVSAIKSWKTKLYILSHFL